MDFIDLPNNFSMVGNLSLQQLPLTNKQPLQTQASPKAQVQSLLKTQVLPFPKPPTQPRSKPKTQRQLKPQLHKFQPFSKPCVQPLSKPPELFDGVRSKLRESLVAALASCDQTKNAQKNERKSSQSEGVNASMIQSSAKLPELQVEIEVPTPQEVPSVSILLSADPQLSNSTVVSANCTHLMPENPIKTSASSNTEFNQSLNVDSIIRNPIDEAKLEFAKMWSCDQDFNPSDIFPEEETSFILKDDLLQGNGLCWASDLDLDNFDVNEIHEAKKFKLMEESFEMQNELSPQILAAKIEEELFKLFGGVNKKYKEKGRSLLFNLKDRNNPELRERVMAGKIPAEKLCSMTAEELASEELSQWRIAKAEELAQMVVLPDSEVDLRRVMKKTHKGEFQVEFEHDDGASVEVAIGESSLTKMPSQTTATKGQNNEIVKIDTNEKISSDGDKPIIPVHDGIDLVQGPTVDDELKDTDFLPPIVSLDEFMESLHDGPAFDNSPGNGTKAVTLKEGNLERSGPVGDLAKSNLKEAADILHLKKNAETEMTKKSDNDLKSDECEVESKVISGFDDSKSEKATSVVDDSKDEKVWNGILQLSISSLVTVAGYFKSGERTSTKEWPSLLEIKGRVKLDPFKKFLKELPKSRSRAIMIVQLSWEKDTSESVQSKVVASYAADERVGLAEPAPGVEMYICPAHSNMSETLSGVLPKDHAESIKAVEGGLIGIVVWRRAMSSTSPRPSTHRQNSRKHHSSSLKKQQQGKRIRVEQPPPKTQDAPSTVNTVSTPDDDVPPGFGPETCRKSQDDDDLPEFEFGHTSDCKVSKPEDSGKGLLGPPPRRVEQVRDLIHRYGQNKASSGPVSLGPPGRVAGIEIQPWNDDDDDIPEWQPGHEARPQSQPLPAAPQRLMGAVHPYHQLSIHSPRMIPQHLQVGLQPPLRMAYHSQSAQAPDQATQQPWQRSSSSGTPAIGVASIAGQHYYSMPSQTRTEWRPYR